MPVPPMSWKRMLSIVAADAAGDDDAPVAELPAGLPVAPATPPLLHAAIARADATVRPARVRIRDMALLRSCGHVVTHRSYRGPRDRFPASAGGGVAVP